MHLQPWFSFGKLDEGGCPQNLPIAFVLGVDIFADQNTALSPPATCPLIPTPQHCCSGVIMQHVR